MPGVTVDRFGEFVVVQWLSQGALGWRDELYDAIEATAKPRGIYEQRRFRPLAGQAPPEPAVRARGDEAPLEIVVEDGGCRFGVDVTAPLGVGLFPDMRLGWAAVAAHAAERRFLNLFSYTGAFSVFAAKAGAREVMAVDLAAKVHARARRNFELSGLDPAKMESMTGDAIKALEKFASRGRKFDLIVCDPPTFSHGPAGPVQRHARSRAGRGASRCRCSSRAASWPSRPTRPRCRRRISTARSAMAPRWRAPTCASSSASACRLDYPVAPGFPEGNYLKLALAVRA